jgi:uncharacterized DUF497 family protein
MEVVEIEFTWDPNKADANLAKHGVSFEAAKQIFFDPFVIVLEDREADGEIRYHAVGRGIGGPLLVTVFADRSSENVEVIRIISAREAERYEQRAYTRQFEEGN